MQKKRFDVENMNDFHKDTHTHHRIEFWLDRVYVSKSVWTQHTPTRSPRPSARMHAIVNCNDFDWNIFYLWKFTFSFGIDYYFVASERGKGNVERKKVNIMRAFLCPSFLAISKKVEKKMITRTTKSFKLLLIYVVYTFL